MAVEARDEYGRLRLINRYYEKILPNVKALGGNGVAKPDKM
jgi:hypothetical protein